MSGQIVGIAAALLAVIILCTATAAPPSPVPPPPPPPPPPPTNYAPLPISAICANSAAQSTILLSGNYVFGCRKSSSSAAGNNTYYLSVYINLKGYPATWTANPTYPFSSNATLAVDPSSGDVVLSDSDSAAVWRATTTASGVGGAEGVLLTSSGNLRIVDRPSEYNVLWQSFSEPLDVLLPGQIMEPGMNLSVFSSSPPFSSLLFSAAMEPSGFIVYAIAGNRRLPYIVLSSTSLSPSSCSSYFLRLSFDAKNLSLLCNASGGAATVADVAFGSAVHFLRLDPDGDIRGYAFDYTKQSWVVAFDWLLSRDLSSNPISSSRSNTTTSFMGICRIPRICGPYGICSSIISNTTDSANYNTNSLNYTCTCPQLASNYTSHAQNSAPFLPVNVSDSRHGCKLAHPIICSAADQYLIELHGLDYFPNQVLVSANYSSSSVSISKQDCLIKCAGNCSCRAAFYRVDLRACFMYTDPILSFIGLSDSSVLGIPILFSKKLNSSSVHHNQLSRTQSNASNYVAFLRVHNISINQALTSASASSSSSAFAPASQPAIRVSKLAIIVVITVACFCILVLSFLVWACCFRKRRFKALRDEDLCHSFKHYQGQEASSTVLHGFTFTQLQNASDDFKLKLGVGGFGSVYKGTLPNGTTIAIKLLENAMQDIQDFRSQIMLLTSISHPNLIRITGFCADGSHRMLVYEYMPHESLDAWIFCKPATKDNSSPSSVPISLSRSFRPAVLPPSPLKGGRSLDWTTRFNIALDVAKGLAYLHQSGLIHLDIKPQNILLDKKFGAKISDYGLPKLMDQDEGYQITHMRGTPGYMAPEWLSHACATDKSDVYSYGIVLMEMLGGRKIVDLSKPRESWYFPVVAAKMYKEGKVLEILDENLVRASGNFSNSDSLEGMMSEKECGQAKRLLQIAFWCIQEDPSRRPDMEKLVMMLEGQKDVPEPPLTFHFGAPGTTNFGSLNASLDVDVGHNSGSSSPSCFNISLASEASSMNRFNPWSGSSGGQLDDCTLLLPSQVD